MIRSRLKTKANKSKNTSDIAKFERQRNLVAAMNKSPCCSVLRNLVLIVIPNQFGKHVNRTFQIKIVNTQENITLLEKDKLSSKQEDVASTFNKHF